MLEEISTYYDYQNGVTSISHFIYVYCPQCKRRVLKVRINEDKTINFLEINSFHRFCTNCGRQNSRDEIDEIFNRFVDFNFRLKNGDSVEEIQDKI